MKAKWIAIAIVVAGAGAYALFSGLSKPTQPPAQTAVRSHVAAEGKIEAMPGFDVDVASGELNGKVKRILVREGDSVAAGQLVAELENEDARARVTAAERELAVARSKLRELEAGARKQEIAQAAAALAGATAEAEEAGQQVQRFRELRAKGMVAQSALDERERMFRVAQAKTREADERKRLLEEGPRRETVTLYQDQVKSAQAGLEYSRKLVEKTLVRAPISGTVIKRYLDEGEGVTPEIAILAIADLNRIWVNAEVDETDAGGVSKGDRAAVTSDAYPGRVFEGRVLQVADYSGPRKVKPSSPAVNLGMKVVQAKIGLADPGPLKLGMTVNVKILREGR